jgi:hypothetical protein
VTYILDDFIHVSYCTKVFNSFEIIKNINVFGYSLAKDFLGRSEKIREGRHSPDPVFKPRIC